MFFTKINGRFWWGLHLGENCLLGRVMNRDWGQRFAYFKHAFCYWFVFLALPWKYFTWLILCSFHCFPSTKKVKSLSKSRRAKIAKKVDNARLVAEQVMGDEFDLDSDDELQIDERLGKEKASLIIRSSMFLFYFFSALTFHVCFRLSLLTFWFTRL